MKRSESSKSIPQGPTYCVMCVRDSMSILYQNTQKWTIQTVRSSSVTKHHLSHSLCVHLMYQVLIIMVIDESTMVIGGKGFG